MDDMTLELLWSMLTDDQLIELREKGAMDARTMQSFKTEMFKWRHSIELETCTERAGEQSE